MTFKVKSTWNGQDVKKKANKAALLAVEDGLEFLLGESNKDIPHDEGTLQNSGDVDVEAKGSKVEGVVSYDTPYARRWHEERANFQKGRKHKYLEDALNNNQSEIVNFIANKLGTAFK